ncbi:regulatory protein RecX [Sphingopyxis yananensis]|uniref:regulatory protein RecX n=1 Tax=Sphingopyxis yananensis TaxID=2886687 RepID=UPI001D12A977|nr:RecX family transcriptional regulator [Sphingopyxis yananensis]MCC2602952.1 RecX family transcriptional regulator [Sphingopyxis yananensis]
MNHERTPTDRTKRPLNAAKLDELALAYVARYATSSGKLARYLSRKVAESKWIDDQSPEEAIQTAVNRMEEMRYLDDGQYARMRGGAMMRRGLGPARVRAQLRFDGISAENSEEALDELRGDGGSDDDWGQAGADGATQAAIRFAQRRRFGPFAATATEDRAVREKQVAAFIRAGHAMNLARRILALPPMDHPHPDEVAAILANQA